MIAEVSPLLIDVGTMAGVIAASFTAFGLLVRYVVVPFIWKPLVEAIRNTTVEPVVNPILKEVQDVKGLIVHHLGANGDTPPLRDKVFEMGVHVEAIKTRVSALEDVR